MCLGDLSFAEETDGRNITSFQDEVPPVDPIHPYPDDIRQGQVPLIIDNGNSVI